MSSEDTKETKEEAKDRRQPLSQAEFLTLKQAIRVPLQQIWTSAKCGDLTKKQDPVFIDSQLSVSDACALLGTKGISSAPVYDKTNDSFLRLLDFRDLAWTVIQFMQEGNRHHTLLSAHQASAKIDQMLAKISVTIVPSQFHTSGDLSKQHPFFSVRDDEPLAAAVRHFVQRTTKTRVYRLVVLSSNPADRNSSKEFKSVLSQTDALKFISKHLQDPGLKPITQKTLAELKLVQSEVFSIDEKKTVFDAFSLLIQKNLSSVAVQKANGDFLGAITFAHLKNVLGKKSYAGMGKTCAVFLQELIKQNEENDPLYSLVESDTTLHDTIKRIVGHHLYRVWVIDHTSNKPVGVVSMTDILNILS